jgi:hypothetical protein
MNILHSCRACGSSLSCWAIYIWQVRLDACTQEKKGVTLCILMGATASMKTLCRVGGGTACVLRPYLMFRLSLPASWLPFLINTYSSNFMHYRDFGS